MPEISPADVQAYTRGRLDASDPEVVRMLTAALRVARREVGWHVSPVRTETITIDGPDSRVLWLPTMKLVELISVTENDNALNLATVRPSAGNGPELYRRVALRKTSGARWTDAYSGVEIEMTHGLRDVDDEDGPAEAGDWIQAVLSMVDQMSLVPVSGGTGMSEFGLTGKRVDDVDYRYSAYAAMAEEVVFSVCSILDTYKLPDLEFF